MEKTNKEQTYQINFIKLREAIRNPQIKPIEKALLVNLLLYAGTSGEAFPSEITIAKDFGCSDRYIRECLVSLKAHGLLEPWKKRGYSQSNLYKFNKELYFPIGEKSVNQSSAQKGTSVPVQSGTELPPKEVPTVNPVSSKLQPLYEKALGRPISGIELRRLLELRDAYSEEWVHDAIEVAVKRGKKEFNASYLRFILDDWKKLGKAPPKPVFIPCDKPGCMRGIHRGKFAQILYCDNYYAYQRKMNELKEIWGEEYGE